MSNGKPSPLFPPYSGPEKVTKPIVPTYGMPHEPGGTTPWSPPRKGMGIVPIMGMSPFVRARRGSGPGISRRSRDKRGKV